MQECISMIVNFAAYLLGLANQAFLWEIAIFWQLFAAQNSLEWEIAQTAILCYGVKVNLSLKVAIPSHFDLFLNKYIHK